MTLSRNQILYKYVPYNLLLSIIILSLFYFSYSFLIYHFTGSNILSYIPVESDEVGYFLEIKCAVEKGLFNSNGGYTGYYFDDTYFVSRYLNYGAHGLFILVPYYIFGSLFGWTFSSAIIFNLIIIGLTIIVINYINSHSKATIVASFILLTFFPFIVFTGKLMLEIMFFCASAILATIFYRLTVKPSKILNWSYVLLVILICLFKITNLVFIIPYIVINCKNKKFKVFIFYIFLAFISTIIIYYIGGLWTAPYPFWSTRIISDVLANDGILEFLFFIFKNLIENTKLFLNPFNGIPLIVLLRYLLLVLLIITSISVFFKFSYSDMSIKKNEHIDFTMLGLGLFIFAFIFLINCFYTTTDWIGVRTLSPIIIFLVIYFILDIKNHFPIAIAISVLCIFMLIFIGDIKPVVQNDFGKEYIPNQIIEEIKYNHNTDSRWDNTVLSNVGDPSYDAGIGVLYLFGENIPENKPLKCKYILYTQPIDNTYYELIANDDNYYLYKRK